MKPSIALSLATMIVVGILAVVSWAVGRRSAKWGTRLAVVGLIVMLQGSVMVLMVWAKEP